MAGETAIEWCDATFNPWWGCEKVSPGCAHCYADTIARHRAPKSTLWGAGHEFRFFGDGHWEDPLKWARNLPAKLGRRPRVFCASMADVFEDHPALYKERERLFKLIAATPELDWLLLTKRPEYAQVCLQLWFEKYWRAVDRHERPTPLAWTSRDNSTYGVQPNIWMGVSIENSRYTWRADVLREVPVAVRFISAEPLLDSLFRPARVPLTVRGRRDTDQDRKPLDLSGIDWLIIGGESGPGARHMRLTWTVELLEACRESGTAAFVKQLGGSLGKLLHAGAKGGEIAAFPEPLQTREFPR